MHCTVLKNGRKRILWCVQQWKGFLFGQVGSEGKGTSRYALTYPEVRACGKRMALYERNGAQANPVGFSFIVFRMKFLPKKEPWEEESAGYQNEDTSEFIDFYLLNEYFSNYCLLSHVYPHMHLYQLRCPKVVCILGKREWLGSLFTWERCLNVLCCWSLVIINVFWAWPGAVWTHLVCSQPWFCVQIYPARLIHKPLVFHGRTGLETTCLGISAGSVFTAATHMSRRGGLLLF